MIRTLQQQYYTHTYELPGNLALVWKSYRGSRAAQSYRCPPFAGVQTLIHFLLLGHVSPVPQQQYMYLPVQHIYICALYQGPLRGELCKKNGDLTVQDVYSSGLEKILLVLVTHFVVQVQGFYSAKNKKINKIHSYYMQDLYLKISKFLEILSLQETIKFVKRPTNIMDLIKRPKNLFVIIFE